MQCSIIHDYTNALTKLKQDLLLCLRCFLIVCEWMQSYLLAWHDNQPSYLFPICQSGNCKNYTNLALMVTVVIFKLEFLIVEILTHLTFLWIPCYISVTWTVYIRPLGWAGEGARMAYMRLSSWLETQEGIGCADLYALSPLTFCIDVSLLIIFVIQTWR